MIKLIKIRRHNILGKLEYYLTKSYSDEFPEVTLYGVEIRKYGEQDRSRRVDDVDCNEERMLKFINCLADGLVTPDSLFDMCYEYIEMLTDRSEFYNKKR